MKKIVLLLIVGFAVVNAHSGGTDSSGCHMNHKTGVYHCHRSDSKEIMPNKIVVDSQIKEELLTPKKDTHSHDHS